jgi:hypothetical protein
MADTDQVNAMRGSKSTTEQSDFDYRKCTYAEGWVQIDTNQDASCYRIWFHPDKRQIVSFHDGRITIIRCTDDETFVAEMRHTAEWNREQGYWIGIDAGEDQRHRCIGLGLADLLH